MAQLSPGLAPPWLQGELDWQARFWQLLALHIPVCPGQLTLLTHPAGTSRLCSHQLSGTAGPTPRFPLRAAAAAARGREGREGRAGTAAPSRISQAIPTHSSWERNEETLTEQNPAPGGERSGDGVTPGCQIPDDGCAKNRVGWEGRAASAVGLGFTLQWGWNSSHSPEMSGMSFLAVELQLILQPQWPQGAQPQQTQSTRQQPSRKPHRGSKIQFKQPLSIQGCLSWDN